MTVKVDFLLKNAPLLFFLAIYSRAASFFKKWFTICSRSKTFYVPQSHLTSLSNLSKFHAWKTNALVVSFLQTIKKKAKEL